MARTSLREAVARRAKEVPLHCRSLRSCTAWFKAGNPSRWDEARMMTRPWAGMEVKTVTHPHFGLEPVQVFAIKVN